MSITAPTNEQLCQKPSIMDMGNDHYVISFPEPEKPFIVRADVFEETDFELRMPFLFKVIDIHDCPLGGLSKYICELNAPGTVTPNHNYDFKPALKYQLLKLEVALKASEIRADNLNERIKALEAKLA